MSGKINDLTKYQSIDVDTVLIKLDRMKNNNERLALLGADYPSLFVYVSTEMKLKNVLAVYKKRCKSFKNNFEMYSFYVHGYLLPLFQKWRDAGKFKYGKCRFQ